MPVSHRLDRLRMLTGGADPWVPVVALVALATYALHGFAGVLSRDLALYGYAGQQVTDGVPPYVAVLNRAGPLAHLLPALGVVGARWGGFDELLGMRILFLLVSVACVCLVFVLGRDLFSSRLVGAASAATFLTFQGFIEMASNGPREKTPMLLFTLCALWAVTRRRWFTAGLFVSVATLVLQVGFFVPMTAAVVAALLVPGGRRLVALARICLGGVVPALVAVASFAVAGALRELLDAFLLINLRYSVAAPLLRDPGAAWSELTAGFGGSVWLLLLGLASICLLSLTRARAAARSDDPAPASIAALGAAAAVGIVWLLRDYDSWPDAFPLLPLAALGVGGALATFVTRLSRRGATTLLTSWTVLAVAAALLYSVGERDDRLVEQRRSVRAVLAVVPDATLLSIEAPQPLVLAGRTNPVRHQMFSSGLNRYVEDTWPGGFAGFQDTVLGGRPTLIAINRPKIRYWRSALAADYERVGRAPGWAWFARTSLGADVVADLRRLHR
jgi:4-amino-4-deoxy-L-arabinose transferase-like glycosyltransferase